jgi:hypothetical protein
MLRISVDSVRLYEGDDPNYELWLTMVVDRVNEKNRAEAAKMKRGTKK